MIERKLSHESNTFNKGLQTDGFYDLRLLEVRRELVSIHGGVEKPMISPERVGEEGIDNNNHSEQTSSF